MKPYKLKVIFGEEQSRKTLDGVTLTLDEQQRNIKEYSFNSYTEKQAFIHGLSEAIGWFDYCIPEFEIVGYKED